MQQIIKFDALGKITAGDECGSYVRFVDDSESTGGVLILTSLNVDMSPAFDGWVDSLESLERYVSEAKWQIEWLVESNHGSIAEG